MSRDLFAATFTPRQRPTRSKWTIVGSFFAHLAAVGAILIVPIVSTMDSPVVAAKLFFPPMPAPVPPTPAPPAPNTPKPVPTAINAAAAPAFTPDKPVTEDAAPPGPHPGPVPIDAFGTGGPPSAGSLFQGPAVTTLTPPPPKAGPVRLHGGITPPARITYTAPVYPTIAQTAKVEGTVILEATIDESGVVRDLRVLRSIPLLDRAAIEAVGRWRYTPTRLNGVAVAIIMTVTVTFTLR